MSLSRLVFIYLHLCLTLARLLSCFCCTCGDGVNATVAPSPPPRPPPSLSAILPNNGVVSMKVTTVTYAYKNNYYKLYHKIICTKALYVLRSMVFLEDIELLSLSPPESCHVVVHVLNDPFVFFLLRDTANVKTNVN